MTIPLVVSRRQALLSCGMLAAFLYVTMTLHSVGRCVGTCHVHCVHGLGRGAGDGALARPNGERSRRLIEMEGKVACTRSPESVAGALDLREEVRGRVGRHRAALQRWRDG